MLNFLKDLFRPAVQPAKRPPREDPFDYFNDGWTRSDTGDIGTFPVRFHMGTTEAPSAARRRHGGQP